jgi:selenide,water dikinase
LILTKPLGTGFVTTAHKRGDCPEALVDQACESMIQLNDVGRDVMIAHGARAATDVTGFGLAGHSLEMALGSGVTIVLYLSKLPLLPGVEAFARKPYLTRASATNSSYVASEVLKEGKLDPVRLECFYDAQTSGGILMSVPADSSDAAVTEARNRGAAAACVIGEVIERCDKAIILRA